MVRKTKNYWMKPMIGLSMFLVLPSGGALAVAPLLTSPQVLVQAAPAEASGKDEVVPGVNDSPMVTEKDPAVEKLEAILAELRKTQANKDPEDPKQPETDADSKEVPDTNEEPSTDNQEQPKDETPSDEDAPSKETEEGSDADDSTTEKPNAPVIDPDAPAVDFYATDPDKQVAELADYLPKDDPFQTKPTLSAAAYLADQDQLMKVQGHGYWQSEGQTDATAKWYLAEDGTLHISEGEAVLDQEEAKQSLWTEDWGDKVKAVEIEGPVTLSGSADYLFADLPEVTEVKGLKQLDFGDLTSAQMLFAGDESISRLDASEVDFKDVTDLTGAFSQMEGLQSIKLDDLKTNDLTQVAKLFAGDFLLEAIDLTPFKLDEAIDQDAVKGWLPANTKTQPNRLKTLTVGEALPVDVKLPAGNWVNQEDEEAVLDARKEAAEAKKDDPDPLEAVRVTTIENDTTGTFVNMPAPVDKSTYAKKANVQFENPEKSLLKWYVDTDNALHITGGTFDYDEKTQKIKTFEEILIKMKVKAPNITAVYIESEAPFTLSGVIDGLFQRMKSVTKFVGLDQLDVTGVTSMDNLFANNEKLTSLVSSNPDSTKTGLEGWKVNGVTSAAGLFSGSGLTGTLDLNMWNFASLKNASNMFSYMKNIKRLLIGDWQLSQLNDMSQMFSNSTSLEDFGTTTIKWNLNNVTNAKMAFLSTRSLTAVPGSGNWHLHAQELKKDEDGKKIVSQMSDLTNMFNGSGIKELDMSNWTVSSTERIINLLPSERNLTTVAFGEDWTAPITLPLPAKPNSYKEKWTYLNDGTELTGNTYTPAKKDQKPGVGTEKTWNDAGTYTLLSINQSQFQFVEPTDSGDKLIASRTINWLTPQDMGNQLLDMYAEPQMTGDFANYVYKVDPFQLDFPNALAASLGELGQASYTVPMIHVQAKGQTADGLHWYVDMDGVLHLGGTTISTEDQITTIIPGDVLSKVNKISIDTDMTAGTNMLKVFSGLKTVTEIDGLDKINVDNVIYLGNLFSGSSGIEVLDGLDKWNTTNVQYMNNVFEGLTNLKSLKDINGWNFSKVKQAGAMFKDMTKANVDGFDPSSWDTSNLEGAPNMFQNFPADTLDLSRWNLSKLNTANFMFSGMPNITSLGDDLSKWNLGKLNQAKGMFSNLPLLSALPESQEWQIHLNASDTQALTLTGMFQSSGITELDTTGWMIDDKTELTDIFSKTALTKITFGETWTKPVDVDSTAKTDNAKWINQDNPKQTFDGITYLAENPGTYILAESDIVAELQYLDPAKPDEPIARQSVMMLDGKYSAELKSMFAPDQLTGDFAQYVYKDDSLEQENRQPVVIEAKEGDPKPVGTVEMLKVQAKGVLGTGVNWYLDNDGTLHLGGGTMSDMTGEALKASLPEAVVTGTKKISVEAKVIATGSLDNFFATFVNVETISGLGNLDTSGVTSMVGTFSNLAKLTTIDELGNWDVSQVTSTEKMFADTPQLTSVEGTGNWQLNAKAMQKMFANSGIKELDTSNWTVASDMPIDDIFAGTALDKITFGENWHPAVQIPNETEGKPWMKDDDPSVVLGEDNIYHGSDGGGVPGTYTKESPVPEWDPVFPQAGKRSVFISMILGTMAMLTAGAVLILRQLKNANKNR